MLFNSFDFLVFFPVVVLLYYVIPKKTRYIWLLISSYFFYMSWNATYAILIAISTIVTWSGSILLGKMRTVTAKKMVVAGNCIVNLGILFFFKYWDFTIANINRILAHIHVSLLQNPFDVLLPVGISFYTFQALSYLIDVYRGDVEPESNLFKYALFVSFFPQLVAGPIERSKNLLTQVQHVEEIKPKYEEIVNGCILMLWGLFLKMVIADRISILVDYIFKNKFRLGSVELILGAVAFAIQIYCDFCGYSTIAVGAAKVMGFSIMDNFDTPYFAVSISDFWKRWHISLSTWFRDYVYIPLGGSRCSKPRKYLNLMITMLVSGLWHGASWTYIIWGGLHGVYQVLGDLMKPVRKKVRELLCVNTEVFSFRFGQMVVTFALTTFAWIFFRAETVSQAFLYIRRMLSRWNPWVLFDLSLFELGLDYQEMSILVFSIMVMVVVGIFKYKKNVTLADVLQKQNMWFRWACLLGFIFAILVFGEYGVNFDSNKFIYFDF